MSTQQDIYAAGSENRPPMLNKENYVPWSSRLLRYAKSRPNGKLIYKSIMNGPYVRRMIPEPGDADREVPVPETFHEQTDDELTAAEIKQMEADDQAIQTILLGLPEDIYAAVDSCETAQEIWLRVQQMMKGSDIGIQEKKAKLFNEWERNKHFPEKIASNLKFLNNLQPEWSRHVTIVHQTKDSIRQITPFYDFLKYNQKEVDDQRAERLAKTHDPLALMANSNNPFNYPVFHQDQPSPSTYMQQPQPINNNYNPQPSFNQNYMQQPMPNPEDITDPTTAMNMALVLMAKAFKLNYSTPTNNNQRISSNPRNRQIAQPGMNMGQDRQMRMVGANGGNQFRQYAGQNVGYQNGYNAVQNVGNQVVQDAVGVQNVGNQNGQIVVPGITNQNPNGNGNVVAARAEGNATGNNGNQIRCYNCRGLGHLARNCTVRPRRRDAAYLQTQLLIAQKEEAGIQLQAEEFDLMAAAADLDEIEECGTRGGTVDQHPATVEETRAYFESLYNNLATEVEKVNLVNHKLKETNAELTTELARKEKVEDLISKIREDELHHDPPVVHDSEETLQLAQESRQKMKQLNKEIKPANYTKINHLSGVFVSQTAKSQEEVYFVNTSKTATVSKSISIPNEEFLDDTTPSVARKFLNEVKSTIVTLQRVVKHRMTLDTHNWSSIAHQEIHKILKEEIFPIINQVDTRFQNFEIQFLKEAAKFVRDFKSLAKEADESLAKHKALELEIERLLRAVVSQDIMSIVQNPSVVDSSNLQTELDRTKDRLENCIIKKENEYAKLWNDWYKKCEECKYDKISYDKAYNDMQQKIERLQAQLGDQKGNSQDTPCVSNTLDPLSQKLENENVELEFQFLGTVRFGNDHVAAILGFGDLQWGNILITRSLEGVDLLKGNRSTNLYTINLHEMASASPICLMARATSTKSWLWHQRLSHLNFDTINDLAKNDLVTGLPKFKYHKEHLCPSCEQGKSKRASHPPKPVPNSKQRLHLLHMDLCGPMRIASINGKWYVLRITVLLQSPVIIIRTDNGTEFKNQILKEYFDSVGISHQASSVRTPQQNGVVERRNQTLVEAARTMLIFARAPLFLWAEAIATACNTQNRSIIHRQFNKTPYELINGRKPNISFLNVFGALCYPKNNREDIRKLGAKGDIGFFIGYYADSCAYRVYNRRTKKIMETINVTFHELSAMAFEQSSSKPGLQSLTSGQISLGLDLTYAPSTITTQKPTERELDLLFEAMHDDYIGGQPLAEPRTGPTAQVPQVIQTPTATTTTAYIVPTPTNSSSQAKNLPNTSQDVDKLETQQQHVQHQPATIADNVPNAMFDDNTFVNPFATPSTSAAESSSSQYVDPSNMHTFYQPYPHEYQWTKDHPLEQVIGEPSRSILTRNQLRSDGDMCMYALTVSIMEPKNVKEDMTDPA
ncbi:retrovirus-related pol polyprotein from transposon TNT 1-94 [Tanacetum coccineum]|uniref:Retrovirus-related pol polyprotein from transposon TNT 1-94 n=1 Tax=Tanacetum coccineum TaxID=301880 RepID=A0ABQ5F9E4_9ASTR